ncbi:hypothetical protein D9C01_12640, partial [Corynebacterium diphtheriae]
SGLTDGGDGASSVILDAHRDARTAVFNAQSGALLPDGTLVHDPVEEAEECLVVRLTVTPELDPTWEVVRPDSEDARSISASHVGSSASSAWVSGADFHLRWARGSALSGLTDGGDGASSVILDAHRDARTAVFNAQSGAL